MNDFDNIIDRRHTSSLKWDQYQDKKVLPLWVADMDFEVPPPVIEAIEKRLTHRVFGYTSVSEELNNIIVNKLAKDYNWKIEPEWLVWLVGVVPGLNLFCRGLTEPNSEILTFVPVYPHLFHAPICSKRKAVKSTLIKKNNSWSFDFERIEQQITTHTSAITLCNPHNPLGRVWSKEELLELAKLCEKYDLTICSDDIHCDLILDEDKKHIPIASLDADIAARSVTLMAPTKTYNLAGLMSSFAVISDKSLRDQFILTCRGIASEQNALALTAAEAAYRDSQDWLSDLLDYLRTNRDLIERTVANTPQLSMTHVEATYLAWIEVNAKEIPNPKETFEKAGVGLNGGEEFDGPKNYVRLNFACPRKILEEALERMIGVF